MCATIREGVVKKTVPVLSGSPEADESAPPHAVDLQLTKAGQKSPSRNIFLLLKPDLRTYDKCLIVSPI